MMIKRFVIGMNGFNAYQVFVYHTSQKQFPLAAMISKLSVTLIGYFYTFASLVHFVPFRWDSQQKTLKKCENQFSKACWTVCACALWTKEIFSLIRFVESCTVLEVTVSEFVLHFFSLMLYSLSASFQIDFIHKWSRFPEVFSKFVTFNYESKSKII